MQYVYGRINKEYKESRCKKMRKRITFTFDESIIEKLKETSDKTMIPQSRLVEEAIKIVLEKYSDSKGLEK